MPEYALHRRRVDFIVEGAYMGKPPRSFPSTATQCAYDKPVPATISKSLIVYVNDLTRPTFLDSCAGFRFC